jgi:hypothetical protein
MTVDEQLLIKDARRVPVSQAIYRAIEKRIAELQGFAIEKAGTVDPKEIELTLVRAQALKWVLDLPDKISKAIKNEV